MSEDIKSTTTEAPDTGDIARFVRDTDQQAVPFHARIVKRKPYRDMNGQEHTETCYMTRLEDTAPHLDKTGTYGVNYGHRGGRNLFGKSSFAVQQQLINSGLLPEIECENIKKHQDAWGKWAFPCPKKDKGGVAYYGVRLIEGGPAEVDRLADKAEARSKRGSKRGEKEEPKVSIAFFASDLNPDHFDWTPAELETLETATKAPTLYKAGDIEGYRAHLRPLGEVMQKRLIDAGFDCSDGMGDFHIALHFDDKFVIDDYNEHGARCIPGHPKYLHFHVVARCGDEKTQAMTRKELGEALGIAWNMIEPNRRGGHLFENRTAYLVHIKNRNKTQYKPDIVVTLAGLDYSLLYAANSKRWAQGAATLTKKDLKAQVDWLREEAVNGRIRLDDILNSAELYDIYACTQAATASIRDAFATYEQRACFEQAARLGVDYEKSVLFFWGPAGSGKSAFVRGLIAMLVARFGWRWVELSPKNAGDDYHGEEVVVLDDCYASAMKAEDWGHLLDAHKAYPLSARYRNKPPIAPRLIIIVANTFPMAFFSATQASTGAVSLPLGAFMRRIPLSIWIQNADDHGAYNVKVSHAVRASSLLVFYDPNSGRCMQFLDDKKGLDSASQLVSVGNERIIRGVDWKHECVDGSFSPIGALYPILAYLNAQTHGALIRDTTFDAVVWEATQFLRAAYQPAIEARASGTDAGLPPLPDASCAQYLTEGEQREIKYNLQVQQRWDGSCPPQPLTPDAAPIPTVWPIALPAPSADSGTEDGA